MVLTIKRTVEKILNAILSQNGSNELFSKGFNIINHPFWKKLS